MFCPGYIKANWWFYSKLPILYIAILIHFGMRQEFYYLESVHGKGCNKPQNYKPLHIPHEVDWFFVCLKYWNKESKSNEMKL